MTLIRDQPNVLFVCIDALRSDFAVGDYGADKPLFEFLEREGTVFDTTVAAASSTTPCVASYMSGEYPADHGVLSLRDFTIDDDVTTLAEAFDAAGYETSAHVCGPLITETGLDAGFDVYEYRDEEMTVYTDWYDEFKADLESRSEPWFAYLHLWEAHISRDLPPDADGDALTYDESVRGVAEKVAELLDVVDLNETVVAVTGDHGESMRDGTLRNTLTESALLMAPVPFTDMRTLDLRRTVYDRYLRPNGVELEGFYNGLRRFGGAEFPTALHRNGHGYHVYDFLVRVPFAVAGPDVPAEGRVRSQIRQVDLFTTLLSRAGLEPPSPVEGDDAFADDYEEQPAYVRAVSAFDSPDKWLDGVRDDGWKFVKGRGREIRQLFDLESDPDELDNVVDEYPEKAAELESLVDEMVAHERRSDDADVSGEAEERMTDRLEDLGYL